MRKLFSYLMGWIGRSAISVAGTSFLMGAVMLITGSAPADWWVRLLPEAQAKINVDTARWFFLAVGLLLVVFSFLWPLLRGKGQGGRISLIDFEKLARDKFGWKFGADVQAQDLMKALYQAHSDNLVVLEGLDDKSSVLHALPQRFFIDGATIDLFDSFPEIQNHLVVARLAREGRIESWRNLHLTDKSAATSWLSSLQAVKYRGEAHEKHFRNRRDSLQFLIDAGTALETACRSGNMNNWPANDVPGWEDDVYLFLNRLWPSQIDRFKAAGRRLVLGDAPGGAPIADLVRAKLAVLKEFMTEFSPCHPRSP